MVDKPEDDIESNAARLAAEVQEATQNNRKRTAPGGGRALAAAGIFAVAAVGVGAMFFGGSSGQEPVAPPTAVPDSFQTAEGSPFGQLPAPVRETIVEKDTSEADKLKAELDAMRAELDAMRNAPAEGEPLPVPAVAVPATDTATDSAIAAMQTQIDAMNSALDAAEKERQRLATEKDRELARMQAALDAATLEASTRASDGSMGEAEARRAEAESIFARRASSGMIAYGGGSSGAAGAVDAAAGMAGDALGIGGASARKLSGNEAFAREAGSPAKVERAKLIVNPAYTVIQGTMIQATLETFINSDMPGQIRAVVAEDVHSYDGSRILIPRGSKVIGMYSDNVEVGQRRAMVVWTRIIMPDNQSVDISSIGGDAIGQSGITGRVNTHFGSRFGSATLISLLSIAPTIALDDDESESRQDAADAVAENMSSATSAALGGALNRKPTITVKQGSKVTIMVDRDLEIF